MNYDKEYREWQEWPDCIQSITELQKGVENVHFYREKKSYKGLANFTSIRKLLAKQVDQNFLDEIGSLRALEYLEIEVLTAGDLTPLKKLSNLRVLKIDSIRKAIDFDPLTKIGSLEKLFIQNATNLESLEFLSTAHNLVAIGIEGGMYKKQKIKSLKPLACLNKLEALFMTSVQLEDKTLDYLSSIPSLIYLGSARFAPKSNFLKLRQLMPNLVCNWCEAYEV